MLSEALLQAFSLLISIFEGDLIPAKAAEFVASAKTPPEALQKQP